MSWFFVIFYGVYLAMHATLYARFQVLLPRLPWLRAGVLLWFGLMILAPFGARFLEREGYHLAARFCAVTGFWWMGLAGLAWLTSLLSWLAQVLSWLPRLAGLNLPQLGTRGAAWAALLLALAMTLYGAWEAGHVRVERLSLATEKLPPGRDRLVIAQISDLHLSIQTSPRQIKNVVEIIAAQQPDLVVSTGDLVDGTMFEEDGLIEELARLAPPLGKYAIMGNHEFYVGLAHSTRCLERAGFTVLRNQAVTVGQSLALAGVDDPVIMNHPREAEILSSQGQGLYTVLLKHRPQAEPGSLGFFDLQLSGHAHRGQVWPMNYISGALYPMQEGLFDLGQGSFLYANRGAGTWGPPMRILAPPEITIIELRRGAPAGGGKEINHDAR